jgi:hypothetical protein
MPAPRILPDNATLRRWVQDEGLTHEQVTKRVYETTGQKVARSTVAAAMHRAVSRLSANATPKPSRGRTNEHTMADSGMSVNLAPEAVVATTSGAGG